MTSIIRQRKQAILYQLDKLACTDCPLRQACSLNLTIYNTSICDTLMDRREDSNG